jgi:acetylglutamate kinase
MKNIWVVKFGGSLMQDARARRGFLAEAARLSKKIGLVLVHGGGPDINAALEKQGITAKFVKGRRVTDDATMDVVESVLSGRVNKSLAGELNFLGARAAGLSGRDGALLLTKPVKGLGRVGAPHKVNPLILKTLLVAGFLPVLSSVGFNARHGAANVNADEAASAVAVALKARKLIYLTDVAGVLDAAQKTIPVIRAGGLQKLIDGGVITGGMIPKVLSCAAALKAGVGEIDIIDGRAGLIKMKGTRLLK